MWGAGELVSWEMWGGYLNDVGKLSGVFRKAVFRMSGGYEEGVRKLSGG